MELTRIRLTDSVVTDSVVAVGVAAVLTLVVSADQGGGAGPAAYVWAAALGALMFWRRRYARTVLAVTVLGLFAYYAAGFPAIGVAVPVAAALYGAAEAGHRAVAVLAATTVLAVSVTFRLLEGQDFHYVVLYEGAGHAALMAAAITLGELVRARRRIEALTEQHIALEAGRRLSEHKQSLSRDLHDSIGHTLTVAAIHTSVARQEVDRRPEAAAAALGHVSEAVSQALAELRTTVRWLRADPAPPLPDAASVGPAPLGDGAPAGPVPSRTDGVPAGQPLGDDALADPVPSRMDGVPSGLARMRDGTLARPVPSPHDPVPAVSVPSLREVESLAGAARAAGFTVRTRIEPVDVPEVSATAYRLVQEAVTNAMRHSDGRSIAIDVWHETGDLKVVIQDDGTAADAAGESAGLTGMRERVTALGGQFASGPATELGGDDSSAPLAGRHPEAAGSLCPGWHVSARIPLGAADD